MTSDTVIGIAILIVSMSLLVGLTLWSRAHIERIASAAGRSVREIERQFNRNIGQCLYLRL